MTFDDMKKAVIERGISFLPFHQCSMCGYMCGYIIHEGEVEYDTGCYCVNSTTLRSSHWDEVYRSYAVQNEEVKKQMLRDWGLE